MRIACTDDTYELTYAPVGASVSARSDGGGKETRSLHRIYFINASSSFCRRRRGRRVKINRKKGRRKENDIGNKMPLALRNCRPSTTIDSIDIAKGRVHALSQHTQ